MGLVWREQMSVGNELIDTDHKALLELINGVEAALSGKDADKLKAVLVQLGEYADGHFEREEKVARAVGYPNVNQLGQAHGLLRKELGRSKTQMESRKEWPAENIEHFIQFLRSWLVDHVIKEDMLMKPLLIQRPYDFKPDSIK